MKKSLILLAVCTALIAVGFIGTNAYAEGAVSGTVIDADGNAVAGARVSIMGEMHRGERRPYNANTESGEDGSFGFRQVPAGNYMVSAMTRDLGGDREAIEVRDGEITEVELQLQGRAGEGDAAVGAVTGTVTDTDGNPVAGARVMLVQDRNRMRRPYMARTESDENGNFGFRQVPVGEYTIAAMTREMGADREQIEVRENEVTEVALQLQGRGGEEIGVVSGRVIDLDENPVEGVRIMLIPADMGRRGGRGGHMLATLSDQNGGFRFEEVPAGVYVIAAKLRGVGMDQAEVEVVADQEVEVLLQLHLRGDDRR